VRKEGEEGEGKVRCEDKEKKERGCGKVRQISMSVKQTI
jgi:hypothetical protein